MTCTTPPRLPSPLLESNLALSSLLHTNDGDDKDDDDDNDNDNDCKGQGSHHHDQLQLQQQQQQRHHNRMIKSPLVSDNIHANDCIPTYTYSIKECGSEIPMKGGVVVSSTHNAVVVDDVCANQNNNQNHINNKEQQQQQDNILDSGGDWFSVRPHHSAFAMLSSKGSWNVQTHATSSSSSSPPHLLLLTESSESSDQTELSQLSIQSAAYDNYNDDDDGGKGKREGGEGEENNEIDKDYQPHYQNVTGQHWHSMIMDDVNLEEHDIHTEYLNHSRFELPPPSSSTLSSSSLLGGDAGCGGGGGGGGVGGVHTLSDVSSNSASKYLFVQDQEEDYDKNNHNKYDDDWEHDDDNNHNNHDDNDDDVNYHGRAVSYFNLQVVQEGSDEEAGEEDDADKEIGYLGAGDRMQLHVAFHPAEACQEGQDEGTDIDDAEETETSAQEEGEEDVEETEDDDDDDQELDEIQRHHHVRLSQVLLNSNNISSTANFSSYRGVPTTVISHSCSSSVSSTTAISSNSSNSSSTTASAATNSSQNQYYHSAGASSLRNGFLLQLTQRAKWPALQQILQEWLYEISAQQQQQQQQNYQQLHTSTPDRAFPLPAPAVAQPHASTIEQITLALTATNHVGETALHVAAWKAPPTITLLLLDVMQALRLVRGNRNIHNNCDNDNGDDSADSSSSNGHPFLRLTDAEGNTPLHLACANHQSYRQQQQQSSSPPSWCSAQNGKNRGEATMSHDSLTSITTDSHDFRFETSQHSQSSLQQARQRRKRQQEFSVIKHFILAEPVLLRWENAHGDTPLHLLVASPGFRRMRMDTAGSPSMAQLQNIFAAEAAAEEAVVNLLQMIGPEQAVLQPNVAGCTLLHIALGNGGHERVIAQLLTAAPAAAAVPDQRGMLPLHYVAAGLGRDEGAGTLPYTLVEQLVNAYPEAITTQTAHGDTPLHLLVSNAHKLLSIDEPETQDLQGKVKRGKSGRKGKIKKHSKQGKTAYLDRNTVKLAELLIDHPAVTTYPLLIRNQEQLSPLHGCALFNAPAPLTQLLMQTPVAEQAAALTTDFGATALHLACAYGKTLQQSNRIANVEILATPAACATYDAKDRSPLMVAVENHKCSARVIKTLLRAHAVAAAQETARGGFVPLHLACQNSRVKYSVVKALIKAWPSALEAVTQHGNTALHEACRNGASPKVVQYLVDMYPDAVHQVNDTGQRPLDLISGGDCSRSLCKQGSITTTITTAAGTADDDDVVDDDDDATGAALDGAATSSTTSASSSATTKIVRILKLALMSTTAPLQGKYSSSKKKKKSNKKYRRFRQEEEKGTTGSCTSHHNHDRIDI